MFNAPNVSGKVLGSSLIRLRALSLGAGVQSTTMALMAAQGEIGPMSPSMLVERPRLVGGTTIVFEPD